MPSIKENIDQIKKGVKKLNEEAQKASKSTKEIGNNLKYNPNDIKLIKDKFEALGDELQANIKLSEEYNDAISKLKSQDLSELNEKERAEQQLKINKLIADYEQKLAYVEEKKKILKRLTNAEVKNQELVNALIVEQNKNYENTEKLAQKLSKVALGVYAWFKKSLDESIELGRSVYSMSQRFNSSAEDVQIWNRALELATGTQDIFNDGMKAMIQGMSQISAGRGIAYNNVLKEIGINYSDIASLNPTEQFEQIINALAGVENYSMRASYAQQLFQEKGVLLAGALDGGTESIEKFKEQAKEFGIISDENAKRLTEISFELEKAKSQLSVTKAELIIGLAPAIEVVTEMIKVASPLIKGIAEGIKATGGAGAGLLISLWAMVRVLPTIVAWKKRWQLQAIQTAVAVGNLDKANKIAQAGMGGWIGAIFGVISVLGILVGALSTANKEADKLEETTENVAKASQEIVGSNANDFVTTTETMATKSTYSEITINATIRGEGDNPISDDNAVLVAQLTADEVNKNLGDLIK